MSLKFTILGCGSSMGVPRPDGYFGKCNPNILKIIEQDVLPFYKQKLIVF